MVAYNANGVNGIDNSEVFALAHDLRDAGYAMQAKAPAVIKKGAVNIKKTAREIISGARSVRTTIPAYPYAIGFSLLGRDKAEAQIGPTRRKGKQGKLGNLIEYGGMFNAPIPHLQPALEREAPIVAMYLLREGADVL